jgi:hippurate hydrolase
MPAIPRIDAFASDLTAIRRDFHAHPEIGFQEKRTSGIVADLMQGWGIEVHRGIGGTGVVGVLKGRRPGRRIGLRADMDALPMEEETNLPWRSTTPGVFHGCGHDGHTTMLLGAARYLAETRDFAGTAVFIFQPAEEGLGGARAMLADGLFNRFPCDEIYGMHNSPYHAHGEVGVKPGTAMAGAVFFDITLRGRGAHGAMPELSRDPVVAAAALVQALQTIVSRNVDSRQAAVLSVTMLHTGTAYNVVPGEAKLGGTIRYLDSAVGQLVRDRMAGIAEGVARAFDMTVECDMRPTFSTLENDPVLSREMIAAAADVVGPALASLKDEPVMGSEDFADMLHAVSGAYCTIGQHGTVPLHNPGFVFDDAVLPLGASVYARLVERRGAA